MSSSLSRYHLSSKSGVGVWEVIGQHDRWLVFSGLGTFRGFGLAFGLAFGLKLGLGLGLDN